MNQRRSDGTLHTLREQLPWPEGKPFRILSIDGGGIRGILPAAILTELEQRYLRGATVGNHFDMIAGTSTGGIIALGLGMGLPASSILDLYLRHGAEVFPAISCDLFNLRAGWRRLRGMSQHTYSPAPLRKQIDAIFGQTILGESQRRLCIPSFDGFTEVNVFKTPHHRDYKRDWREEMATIAMATAAAPTFFPVYKDRGRFFADGGVWANNPVMIALVDALACYRLERRQIHILSLGSGDTELRISKNQILNGGLWHWRDVISSAMHLQSQNATGQAGLLIGRDQLVRLNAPAMPENPISLDDYQRSKKELPPIAARIVEEHGAVIRDRFLQTVASVFPSFFGPRAPPET